MSDDRPATHAPVDNVLIVGGGPAGLTAAIALRQAGVANVEIAEINDIRSVVGSELSVASAMLRALDTIGVAEAVVSRGVALNEASLCGLDGDVHATVPFPRVAGDHLPGAVGITRPALHDLLWDAAKNAGAIERMGCEVTAISDGPDNAVVSFSDGTQGTYNLVIGADGVRSTVRSLVFPDAPTPKYAGQMAWRARVPRRTEPMLAVFDMPGRRAGLITVTDTDSYLFLLVNQAEPERISRDDYPRRMREALADFGGPIAAVRDDIVDPLAVHYSPLTPLLLPPPWYRNHVILIGDAAHATTPHLAFGAGLSVEDGVILGQELGRASSLPDGLSSFTTRRWERCRMVVENGLQILNWGLDPNAPNADPNGLTMSSQMAICEPA